MFPQLIAGPIVRYVDIAEQLETRRENITKRLHQRLEDGMVAEVESLLKEGIAP